jgi:hypothetical protein
VTSERRFERDLPQLLTELAAGAPPNYRDDIVQRVARTPQRPAWTFPERWLPMAVVSRRPAVAFNVPWRSLALVALLATMLAIAAGIYVASRPRVPAPFGPARNGLVAYSVDGDIVVREGATGAIRTRLGGPTNDFGPTFSPDGTKVAFLRFSDDLRPTETLMVMSPDGSDQHVVAGPERGLSWMAWSPSGNQIAIVSTANGAQLSLVETQGDPARRAIELPVAPEIVEWLPPDGQELIIRGIRGGSEYSLFAVRLDGSAFRQIAPDYGHDGQYMTPLALHIDGRRLAYGSFDDERTQLRLHLLDLETRVETVRPAAPPPLSAEANTLVHDGSPVFSPDGASLLYNRYFNERTGVITAQVFVGPLEGPDRPISAPQEIPSGTQSLYSQFSPDGASVLMRRALEGTTVPPEEQPQVMLPDDVWLTDLRSQESRYVGVADELPAWQRLAP